MSHFFPCRTEAFRLFNTDVPSGFSGHVVVDSLVSNLQQCLHPGPIYLCR